MQRYNETRARVSTANARWWPVVITANIWWSSPNARSPPVEVARGLSSPQGGQRSGLFERQRRRRRLWQRRRRRRRRRRVLKATTCLPFSHRLSRYLGQFDSLPRLACVSKLPYSYLGIIIIIKRTRRKRIHCIIFILYIKKIRFLYRVRESLYLRGSFWTFSWFSEDFFMLH